MTIQINPDKLAELERITLDRGPHLSFESGHCAMEVVAWLADEGHTFTPACASRVIRKYTITLNDRWSGEQRQRLKPFLPRMVGTGDDGKDAVRERIIFAHLAEVAVPWLELAGLDTTAITSATTIQETREAFWSARTAAVKKQADLLDEISEMVADKLKAHGNPDDFGVVHAEVIRLDALALAAAFKAVDAVAAATHAVEAATVNIIARATAVHAVAAVAATLDAALDVAVDAASEGGYIAASVAVRNYYRENPPLAIQKIADLAHKQDDAALELLDRLITVKED